MKQHQQISASYTQQVFLGILKQNVDSFKVSDNNVTSNAFKVGQRENEVAGHIAASVYRPFISSNDQATAIYYTVRLLSVSGYVCLSSKKYFSEKL